MFCVVLFVHFGVQMVPLFGLTFVISRILSGLGVAYFPGAKKDGMLATQQKVHDTKIVGSALIIELAICACFMVILHHLAGLILVAVALLCFAWYRVRAVRDFGGVTGDTAGCFLCMAELAQVLALAVFAAATHLIG